MGIQQADEILFVADGAHWIWNRIPDLVAALGLDSERVHELIDFYHAEARWGETRRRDVRNALSRSGLRIIGEGNAQDRPASPVDLGDGEGGYHCTRWSNA